MVKKLFFNLLLTPCNVRRPFTKIFCSQVKTVIQILFGNQQQQIQKKNIHNSLPKQPEWILSVFSCFLQSTKVLRASERVVWDQYLLWAFALLRVVSTEKGRDLWVGLARALRQTLLRPPERPKCHGKSLWTLTVGRKLAESLVYSPSRVQLFRNDLCCFISWFIQAPATTVSRRPPIRPLLCSMRSGSKVNLDF